MRILRARVEGVSNGLQVSGEEMVLMGVLMIPEESGLGMELEIESRQLEISRGGFSLNLKAGKHLKASRQVFN